MPIVRIADRRVVSHSTPVYRTDGSLALATPYARSPDDSIIYICRHGLHLIVVEFTHRLLGFDEIDAIVQLSLDTLR